MAKSKAGKNKEEQVVSAAATGFVAETGSIDPTLASLFASSSGPIQIRRTKTAQPSKRAPDDEDVPSDVPSDIPSDAEPTTATPALAAETLAERPRKRRRVADNEELETKYFKRLEQEEEKETQQRQRAERTHDAEGDEDDATSSSGSEASPNNLQDFPRHEALDQTLKEKDQAKRTVFLGNVSTEAIKSKMASRELTKVLHALASTKVQDKALGKLESLRFRSTAYTSGSGPKKATYAKKELMDETTTSTNAYAVFTTEAAAEHVAENLNGTVVLDRHIRADYLGRPAKIDNRRCIFVGNLSFVNEETSAPADGEQKRPTAKVPADAEEGLWRTFGKVGEVESVRVVRDQETRVSKGFGYVQFRSENSVEAALLLNDRKFPPMLPRKLRVMRAKKTKSREQPSGAVQGRPFGRDRAKNGGGKVRPNGGQSGPSGRAGLVFEGHRASSTSGKYSLGGKKKHKKRPDTRSSRRGAAYKAAGARDRRQGKA